MNCDRCNTEMLFDNSTKTHYCPACYFEEGQDKARKKYERRRR